MNYFCFQSFLFVSFQKIWEGRHFVIRYPTPLHNSGRQGNRIEENWFSVLCKWAKFWNSGMGSIWKKIWSLIVRSKWKNLKLSRYKLFCLFVFFKKKTIPFLVVVCDLIVWMQKWFCLSQLLFPAQEQLAIVVKMVKAKPEQKKLTKNFSYQKMLHIKQ